MSNYDTILSIAICARKARRRSSCWLSERSSSRCVDVSPLSSASIHPSCDGPLQIDDCIRFLIDIQLSTYLIIVLNQLPSLVQVPSREASPSPNSPPPPRSPPNPLRYKNGPLPPITSALSLLILLPDTPPLKTSLHPRQTTSSSHNDSDAPSHPISPSTNRKSHGTCPLSTA